MTDVRKWSAEDIAVVERIARHGELQALDRVEVVGLTSAKGAALNGRIGTVRALSGKNDGTSNPYVARRSDERYQVDVDFDDAVGRETRPGQIQTLPDTKTFLIKRENLMMHDAGPGTLARDPEGRALLLRRGIDVKTNAQRDAEDPGTAGWFPAILQGDVARTKEILDHLKSKGGPCAPAEVLIDAKGDAALQGAIQRGHPEIVRLLLEYGADPNRCTQVPAVRDMKLSYFHQAILLFDHVKNSEEIVTALIDGVGSSLRGDVNAVSLKGTPLTAAAMITSNHATRMRICKKLLDRGADPNQIVRDPLGNECTLLNHLLGVEGCTERPEGLELFRLLLGAGADPGRVCRMGLERVNAIHVAVNRRMAGVLRCFLSCAAGTAAVDARHVDKREYAPGENSGDGETALCMCVSCENLEVYRACRDMAVQLLRAGADPEVTDENGVSAMMWLRDRNPDPGRPHKKKEELFGLYKKAKGFGPGFWDSVEVRRFVEKGQNVAP